MSRKVNWNEAWLFTKDAALVKENTAVNTGDWEKINLPHTWNGKDGQDGGNDYYRNTCYYTKRLDKALYEGSDEVYIEFEGANSSADVYVNGSLAVHHDGGYSTFRANITELLTDDTEIVVAVDNAPNDRVYPQVADFTFYGGLYRNVNIICVSKAHFDLDYFGGPGITVTPVVEGTSAHVNATAYLTGLTGSETIKFVIKDNNNVVAENTVSASSAKADFVIENTPTSQRLSFLLTERVSASRPVMYTSSTLMCQMLVLPSSLLRLAAARTTVRL